MGFGTLTPGTGPTMRGVETATQRIISNRIDEPEHGVKLERVTIVSTALDAGNTNFTTQLRAGLPMGKITATGKYQEWDADGDATDGTADCAGILWQGVDMFGPGHAVEDKSGSLIAVSGQFKSSMIIGLSQALRAQLANRGFVFNDDLISNLQQGPLQGMRTILDSTTATTIADDESGITYLLSNAASVTMTLPAIAVGGGQEFIFYRVADEALIITSAEGDNIVGFNELAADTITFTTATEHIGACILIRSVDVAGTPLWLSFNIGGANTVAYAG